MAGFGRTNPNSISENKVLVFLMAAGSMNPSPQKANTFAIVRFFAYGQIAPVGVKRGGALSPNLSRRSTGFRN
jgi:hypothetical protein